MRKRYAIGFAILIIGIITWILILITGGGTSQEDLTPGDTGASIPSQNQQANNNNNQEETIKETNKTNKPTKQQNKLDFRLNVSSEALNYPSLVNQDRTNATITRVMFLGEGLWDVLGRNVYDLSMPIYLKDSTIKNNEGEYIGYKQKINFPKNITLINFTDTAFRDGNATIGFNLSAKETILQYEVSLTKSIPIQELEGQEIIVLGKRYYIREVEPTGREMTLLETPYSIILTLNNTYSIAYPGYNPVELSAEAIEEGYTLLQLGNETSSTLEEGQTYTHKNLTIVINEILYNKKGTGQVRAVISPKELVFEDSTPVRINTKRIEDLYFETYPEDSTTIDGFRINWEPRQKEFVTYNSSLLLPNFRSIRISMSNWAYFNEEIGTDEYVYLYVTTQASELLLLNGTRLQKI